MTIMKPLEEWICDTCGETAPINNCAVEWLSSSTGPGPRDFRIVHKSSRCYSHTRAYDRADSDVGHFLGVNGLQAYLAMLSIGPILDPDQRGRPEAELHGFADVVRRTQIPYYEEARLYFADARNDGWFSDQNEVSIFLPTTCKAIIERYES